MPTVEHDRTTVSRSEGWLSLLVRLPCLPSDHWSRPISSPRRTSSGCRQSRFHFPSWWYPQETSTNGIEQIFGTGEHIALNIIMDRSTELPGNERCHLPHQPCRSRCQWMRSQRHRPWSQGQTNAITQKHMCTLLAELILPFKQILPPWIHARQLIAYSLEHCLI